MADPSARDRAIAAVTRWIDVHTSRGSGSERLGCSYEDAPLTLTDLRVLVADGVGTATPADPRRGDGEGGAEVWMPPSTDCMDHGHEPCPHCGSRVHHHRTGRCGACGRRPAATAEEGPTLRAEDLNRVAADLSERYGWMPLFVRHKMAAQILTQQARNEAADLVAPPLRGDSAETGRCGATHSIPLGNQPSCALPFGHGGWHRDGQAEWGRSWVDGDSAAHPGVARLLARCDEIEASTLSGNPSLIQTSDVRALLAGGEQ